MNEDYSNAIVVIVLFAIVFFVGFGFGIAFDYFSDGEISCYPSEKIKEIEENNFQFTVRCYIK